MKRFAVLLLLFLVACESTPPTWYLKPPVEDGYRHGAGRFSSSKRREARHMSIQDAAYLIASQKGVEVISVSESEETENGVVAVVRTTQGVEQTVSGFEILEIIEERDPERPHLWQSYALLRIRESLLLGDR